MKNMHSSSFFRTAVTSFAISACISIAGCDVWKDPPTQLEAVLSTKNVGTDSKDKRELAANIVRYMNIEGVSRQNVRVVPGDQPDTYLFRLVGDSPLPEALLGQVAKRLATLNDDFAWSAKLTIKDTSTMFDAFLKTHEHEFPLKLTWKNAAIDAYVVENPFPNMDALLSKGEAGRARDVLCMLSFQPDRAIPRLEGKYEELEGKPENENSMAALRRRYTFGNLVFSVPYDITFDQPVLAKEFSDSPVAKDGKVMFQFASIQSSGIFEPVGDSSMQPTDFSGRTFDLCEKALQEKHPMIADLLSRVELLSNVKAVGAIRTTPLTS